MYLTLKLVMHKSFVQGRLMGEVSSPAAEEDEEEARRLRSSRLVDSAGSEEEMETAAGRSEGVETTAFDSVGMVGAFELAVVVVAVGAAVGTVATTSGTPFALGCAAAAEGGEVRSRLASATVMRGDATVGSDGSTSEWSESSDGTALGASITSGSESSALGSLEFASCASIIGGGGSVRFMPAEAVVLAASSWARKVSSRSRKAFMTSSSFSIKLQTG